MPHSDNRRHNERSVSGHKIRGQPQWSQRMMCGIDVHCNNLPEFGQIAYGCKIRCAAVLVCSELNGAGKVKAGATTIFNIGAATWSFSTATSAQYTVQNLLHQSPGSGANRVVTNDGLSSININDGFIFGTFSGGTHIFCVAGHIGISAGYTISGAASNHVFSSNSELVISYAGSIAVTITGTPAFASYFATAQHLGQINTAGVTWSGSATGVRYNSNNDALIYMAAAGASYLPDNAAGATSNGGIYG